MIELKFDKRGRILISVAHQLAQEGLKYCAGCSSVQEIGDFSSSASYCKSCDAQRYQDNQEKRKEQAREYRESRPAGYSKEAYQRRREKRLHTQRTSPGDPATEKQLDHLFKKKQIRRCSICDASLGKRRDQGLCKLAHIVPPDEGGNDSIINRHYLCINCFQGEKPELPQPKTGWLDALKPS